MVRDLIVPFRRRLLRLFGVMLLAVIPFAVIAGVSRLPPALVGGMSALIGILGLVVYEERAGKATLRRLTAKLETERITDPQAIETAVQETLTKYATRAIGHSALGGYRRQMIGPLAALLAQQGIAGRAYRIAAAPADLGAAPTGFDMPFEPIPLNPRSEAFHALRGGRPTTREALRERWSMMSGQFGRSLAARIFIIASLGIAVIAWIFVVYDVIASLLRGRTPLVFQHVLVIVPVVLLTVLVQLWKPVQWLVVPGAILVRRAPWWSSESELFMFRRDESVLIHWRDRHMLGIGDRSGNTFSTLATPAMVEVAFRAWLCPLPPPEERQLAELR